MRNLMWDENGVGLYSNVYEIFMADDKYAHLIWTLQNNAELIWSNLFEALQNV